MPADNVPMYRHGNLMRRASHPDGFSRTGQLSKFPCTANGICDNYRLIPLRYRWNRVRIHAIFGTAGGKPDGGGYTQR